MKLPEISAVFLFAVVFFHVPEKITLLKQRSSNTWSKKDTDNATEVIDTQLYVWKM